MKYAPRLPLAALILVASCSTPTRTGWTAYNAGDFPAAMRAWQSEAEIGDADSQYLVGTLFDEGRGVRGDARRAAEWYRLAAKQGHAPAENNLGLLIAKGEVAGTHAEAAALFAEAVESDFAPAECNLGLMHLLGVGVDKDLERAHDLLFLAARQGDMQAERLLGTVYDRGLGVEPSPGRARMWYRRAAEQGSATARLQLGLLYLEGRGVPASESLALRWIRPAAEVGLCEAEYAMGWLLRHGVEVGAPGEAVAWIESAAQKDFAPAQAEIGLMHLGGDGVTPNDVLATEWLRKSANQNYSIAQYNLAQCYVEGRGVPVDMDEAELLFRRAANGGLTEAKARLDGLWQPESLVKVVACTGLEFRRND